MYGYIYITTNLINGKKYIGKSTFRDGWKSYLGSGVVLKKAIEKYERDNFCKDIVYLAQNEEELNVAEREFIECHGALKNNDYYNIALGGEGGNVTAGMTPEQYERYRERVRGKNNPMYGIDRKGEKAAFYGRKHTEETKEKLRIANTGKKHTDEAKRKMSEKRKGKKPYEMTDEIRENFRKAKLGRKLSEEHKKNIGNSVKGSKNGMFGKKHTEEARRKMSEAQRNRKPVGKKCRAIHIATGKTYYFDTQKELSDFVDVPYTTICRLVKNGKIKNGYKLEYQDISDKYFNSAS